MSRFSDAENINENINAHAFKIKKKIQIGICGIIVLWYVMDIDSSHRKMYALLSFDRDDREQYDKNKRMSMRQKRR